MTITLITATVKQPATLLQTQWGERLKVTVNDGYKDIELWRKTTDSTLLNLTVGQQITMTAKPATSSSGNSYTQYDIVGSADRPPSPPAPTNGNGNGNGHTQPSPGVQAMQTPVAHPAKPALNADVQEWISIFDELKAALPQAQESTWRAAASTLFIQRLQVRADFKNEVF